MLPVLSASSKTGNPRFEALYNDLCKNKLRSDGSSVLDREEQRQRLSLEADLYTARLQAARRDVIVSSMRELCSQPGALPFELHELIALVSAQLEGQLTGEDADIAHDATRGIKDRLPTIAPALSAQLQQDASTLRHLTKTQDELPPNEVIKQWKDSISDSCISLIDLDRQQTAIAEQMHSTYRQLIELSVRALEQTIHGAVSRATKAKADYLVIVLEGMAKKLEVQYGQLLSQLDSDGIRQALQARNQDLAKQNRQLKSQVRDREDVLDDHKREAGNEALASEYFNILQSTRALEKQVEELRASTV